MPSLRFILVITLPLMMATHTNVNAMEGDDDNDGVANAVDKCPNTAQLSMLPASFKYAAAVNQERLKSTPQAHPVDKFGCEFDSDKDGVLNSQDFCPEDTPLQISMGVAKNGCPIHSDKDGTPDYRDKCPNTPVNVATDKFGCPKQG